MNEWKGISKWKKVEKMYVMDELVYGHNPYWWGAYVSLNRLSVNNHGVYRTMLRAEKNKKRKTRILCLRYSWFKKVSQLNHSLT